MKEIYKNPVLYYALVPVMIALWPLIIGGVYLPAAERSCKKEMNDYKKARSRIADILTIDRDRLTYTDSKVGVAEFKYYDAVDKVAGLCGIPSSNYQLSSRPIITRNKQKTQDCHVVLKAVDVVKFARFLSTIQLRWASLQCINATLTKNKGLPDSWKVALDLRYYYTTK